MRTRALVAGLVAGCLLSASTAGPACAGGDDALPWGTRADGWRSDRAWYDGKAEKCVYDATTTIYGELRAYTATAYTDKELLDPTTRVKSATDDGVEAFKHHWSERVPTENYDYDFSTSLFVRTSDLAPLKLTAATQEDCGASFKELWLDGARLRWIESVYFPGAGLAQGELAAAGLQLEDGLPLLLRDFPFPADEAAERVTPSVFRLQVLPSQRDTHRVPFRPLDAEVRWEGRETLELPAGSVEAHRLAVRYAEDGGVSTYWFAAAGAAPWLHALVAMDRRDGLSVRLRSLERTAYWERP